MKVQNRHLYDFTIHHFMVKKPHTLTNSPIFTIKTSSIILVEGPKVPNAINIRACLNQKLNEDYGIGFDTVQKNFISVTDGAAVIANVAGSSARKSVLEQRENWMRCYVHVLNNVMKSSIAKCENRPRISRVHQDFNQLKKVVGDSNSSGWNSWLPHRYNLRQAIDTRFGTYCLVFERFLKSSHKVWPLIVHHRKNFAMEGNEALLRHTDHITGLASSFSALEVFFMLLSRYVKLQSCSKVQLVQLFIWYFPTYFFVWPNSSQFWMETLLRVMIFLKLNLPSTQNLCVP